MGTPTRLRHCSVALRMAAPRSARAHAHHFEHRVDEHAFLGGGVGKQIGCGARRDHAASRVGAWSRRRVSKQLQLRRERERRQKRATPGACGAHCTCYCRLCRTAACARAAWRSGARAGVRTRTCARVRAARACASRVAHRKIKFAGIGASAMAEQGAEGARRVVAGRSVHAQFTSTDRVHAMPTCAQLVPARPHVAQQRVPCAKHGSSGAPWCRARTRRCARLAWCACVSAAAPAGGFGRLLGQCAALLRVSRLTRARRRVRHAFKCRVNTVSSRGARGSNNTRLKQRARLCVARRPSQRAPVTT